MPKNLIFEIIALVIALIFAQALRNFVRLIAKSSREEPVKALFWGLGGGIGLYVLAIFIAIIMPKERIGLVALLFFLPAYSYLLMAGSIGALSIIWDGAFKYRFFVIPAFWAFSLFAETHLPFGDFMGRGLYAIGIGASLLAMGSPATGQEPGDGDAAGGEAPPRPLKKLQMLEPIFKPRDNENQDGNG